MIAEGLYSCGVVASNGIVKMTRSVNRPLVAANWKMNGDRAMVSTYAATLASILETEDSAEIVICPPAILLSPLAAALSAQTWAGAAPALGAQDCHPAQSGAFTGDLSAAMLKEAGATWMLVGHSERRAGHQENDALIAEKLIAAEGQGLQAILCVGEQLEDRDSGAAVTVVQRQLAGSLPALPKMPGFAVAYEPVWAIGTGRVASQADVAAMHAAIRAHLVDAFGAAGAGIRILYGGSVKPDNAGSLLRTPEVGGLLVGGASLQPGSFAAIARA
jgi:triosephosphate isomerase